MNMVDDFYTAQLVMRVVNADEEPQTFEELKFAILQVVDPLIDSDYLMLKPVSDSYEILLKKDVVMPIEFSN